MRSSLARLWKGWCHAFSAKAKEITWRKVLHPGLQVLAGQHQCDVQRIDVGFTVTYPPTGMFHLLDDKAMEEAYFKDDFDKIGRMVTDAAVDLSTHSNPKIHP